MNSIENPETFVPITDLIPECNVVVTAFFTGESTDLLQTRSIQHNYSVLESAKSHSIIVKHLMNEQAKERAERFVETFKILYQNSLHYTPSVTVSELGHTFGTLQLDLEAFQSIPSPGGYLLKLSGDVFLNQTEFEKTLVPQGQDFYYLNGIGKGGLEKYSSLSQAALEDFYPQTNFYIIDTSKVVGVTPPYSQILNFHKAFMLDKQHNPDLKPWEWMEGFTCEDFLKKATLKLKKYHILPYHRYMTLLQYINEANIHDPSHKNIMVAGVMHAHSPVPRTILSF